MEKKVEIKIKSPTYPVHANLTLFHHEDGTVRQLKHEIQAAIGNAALTPASQKLIYAGHVLDDEATLIDLNLTAGSTATFHLVTGTSIKPTEAVPQPGAGRPNIFNRPSPAVAEAIAATRATLAEAQAAASWLPSNGPRPRFVTRPATADPRDDPQWFRPRRERTEEPTDLSGTGASEAPAAAQATAPPLAETPQVPATQPASSPAATPAAASTTTSAQPSPPLAEPVAPSIGAADVPEHLRSLLGDQACTSTGLQYQVYLIDGLPYLIQQPNAAPTVQSRTARRSRRNMNMLNMVMGQPPVATTPVAGMSQATPTIRHQAVELTSSSAIPVIMANGQRAVILSPEGVRAMTQQGVQVQQQNAQGQIVPPAAARPEAISRVSRERLRNFAQVAMPHVWLLLKLVFLVVMLGSHASWKKFIVLNAIAFVIFLWQSGLLAAAFGGQVQVLRQRAARQAAGPGPAPARPPQGPVDAANQAAGATAIPATPASAAATATAEAQAAPNPPPRNALQNMAHAFVSSILPTTLFPDTAPAPNANNRAAQPEADQGERNRLGNDW